MIIRFLLAALLLLSSFISFAQSPGNVSANLNLWLKADAGITGGTPITAWADQSAMAFSAVPGTGPDLLNSQINFNPAVDFVSASSEYLQITNGILGTTTYNDMWVYVVSKTDIIQNQTMFAEELNVGGESFNGLIPWSNSNIYYDFGLRSGIGRINGNWGTTGRRYHMWTMGTSTSTSTPNGTRKAISRDGVVIINNDNNDNGTGNNNNFYIGGRYTGANNYYFDGKVAEMVVYTSVPSLLEQEKIQSYLAIKYGITKVSVDNADISQDERDYFASDATVIWDYDANAGYNNNITGIGQDDGSGLVQQRSKNEGAGSSVDINRTTAFANLDFLLWGNNALTGSSGDVPGGYDVRSSRVWKLDVTGSSGTVDFVVDLDVAGINETGDFNDYRLFINSSSGFTTPDHTIAATGLAGSDLTFAGVTDFNDGDFVSVGIVSGALSGPGDVKAGLQLWLRADAGVTGMTPITDWDDQSGLGFNASVPANGPDLVNNQLNFNPTLDFVSASSEYVQINNGLLGSGTYDNVWIYAVTKSDINQTNTLFFEDLSGTNETFNVLHPWVGTEYFDFGLRSGSNGRISGAWGGTYGDPYMWTFGTSTGLSTPNGTRKAISRDGAVILSNNNNDNGTGNNSNFIIGGGYAGGTPTTNPFDGELAELVIYMNTPTLLEQEKIQSYLAIKYGITKLSVDNADVSQDEQDYFASDATVIWDYSANAGYNSNITGIGQDDGSGLVQQRSKNEGAGSSVDINRTTAFANLDFLLWGNNALTGSSGDVPGGYDVRSSRVWKLDVTGSSGSVDFVVDLAAAGINETGDFNDYRLFINSTSGFTTPDHTIAATGLAGSDLTFAGVTDFNDGDFVSIGIVSGALSGPGDVKAGLQLWLRADADVTGATPVTGWDDQSGLSFDATATTGPDLLSGDVNFNDALDFDRASSEYMEVTSGLLGSGTYDDMWVYYVSQGDAIVTNTIFNENLASGEYFMSLNPWSNSNAYYQLGTGGSGRLNGAWGGSTGQYYMWTMGTSTGLATPNGTRKAISRDGAVILNNDNNDNGTGNNNPFYIGGRYLAANNYYLDGKISELIVYTTIPTLLEQEKIQSYLAIKYGITKLSVDNVDASQDEQDYFASDATVIWDYDANAGYNNNITGIGQDDGSGLVQQRSKNEGAGSSVDINRTTAFANLDFLLWGNNALTGSSGDVPGGYDVRSSRVWKLDVTGSSGTVDFVVDLDVAGINETGDFNDYRLFINSSSGFTTPDHTIAATGLAGSDLTFAGVTDFNDGDFVSVGIVSGALSGPGDVKAGLQLWLRADAGVTGMTPITDWDDQSGLGFNASVPANGPDLVNNQLNFNPTLDFVSASSEYVQINNGLLGSGTYDNVWIYAVTKSDINQTNTLFFEDLSGTNETFNVLHPWVGTEYFDFGLRSGSNGRISGAWGGTYGDPYMWTFGTSTGLSTPNGTRKAISRDGAVILSNNNNDNGTGNNSNFIIGGGYAGGTPTTNPFDGELAELVIYMNTPTLLEQEKIQSYLAIKYGITKLSVDNADVSQDEQDYFASDATVIWDYSANAGYNSNITGIGQDDGSGLVQQRSKNEGAGSSVDINRTTAFANLDFLLWGNNALTGSSGDVPGGYDVRSSRVWKLDVTGSSGSVDFVVDLAAAGINETGDFNDYRLFINSTSGFTTPDHTIAATGLAGSDLTFAGVTDFNDGDFVSIGIVSGALSGPGDVKAGLQLWLRADADVTGATPVTGWDDQSGLSFDATATTGPDLLSGDVNFNDALDFDRASSEYMEVTSGLLGSGTYDDMWVYYVSQGDAIVTNTIFNENLASGEYFMSLNPWSNSNAYYQLGTGGSGRLNGAWGGSTGQYYMWTMGTSTGLATPNGTRKAISRDGAVILNNDNNDNGTGNNNPFYIGGRYLAANNYYLDGKISELIVYTTIPTLLEQEKIQSYLAIKYGITKLSVDNVDASQDEQDYFASDATVIWDYDANAGYNNNITGIGQDDGSGLVQQRSKNEGAGSSVDINRTTAFANLDFLLWGNNALTGSSGDVPGGYDVRSSRVWKLDVTGSSGTVDFVVDLDVAGINETGDFNDYRLFINSSSGFTTPDHTIAATGLAGSDLTFAGVTDFNDGDFVSVGIVSGALSGPGDVKAGLQLWLRADAGVTGMTPITDWDDQSGLGFNASVPANGPDLVNNQLNFNPTLDFVSASSEYVQINNGLLGSGTYDNVWIYAVTKSDINQTNTLFFEDLSGTNETFNVLHPWVGTEYFDFGLRSGSNGRISGAWGGTYGDPYMWTFGTSTGLSTPNGTRKAISRDGAVILSNNNNDNGTGNNSNFIIGGGYAGGTPTTNPFDGELAELVIYMNTPTLLEQEKIQSYLAIKYGITKLSVDNADVSQDEQDYFASDATVIWDYSANAGYNSNITGIGQDDGSGLVQQRSKNEGAGSSVDINRTTAFANLDFLLWGNNALTGSSGDVPGGYDVRSSRVWKLDVTGSSGSVDFVVDLAAAGINETGDFNDYRLFINSTSGFTTPDHTIAATGLAGSDLTFAGVTDFNDGDFVSIGIVSGALSGPGDVKAGLQLWLRADADVTGATPVTGWDDQSGLSFDATATTGPDLLSGDVNFNDALDFDRASSEYMEVTSGLLGSGTYDDMWVYYVSQGDAIVTNTIFNENLASGEYFMSLNPWSNSNAYYQLGTGGSGRLNGAWGGSTGQYYMWTMGTSTGLATPNGTRKAISRDGAVILNNDNNDNGTGNNNPFYIGGRYLAANNYYLDGKISELIVYTTIPTLLEQEKIQSYLAIKYGITKVSVDNADISQDERDYFASDATVIWDYDANAGYNNNITGIGQDDGSGLVQQRSKNEGAGSSVDINRTTAFANLDFLLWGNNGLNGTSGDIPAGYDARSSRIWALEVQGSSGTVDFVVNLAAAGIIETGSMGDYVLFINSTSGFSTPDHIIGATGLAGSDLSFAGVTDLNDGDFVSIGIVAGALSGPGDVTAGLQLWLRADAGVTGVATVTGWNDQSGLSFDATATAGPELLSNEVNFNEALDFDRASSEYMEVTSGLLGTGTYDNMWVYYVSQGDAIVTNTIFNENLASGEYFMSLNPWSNSNAYYQLGTGGTGRLNGAWGGSLGQYYMWTMGTSTGLSTPSGTRKAISRDGAVILSNNNNDSGTGNNSPFYIGGRYTGANNYYLDGKISELIVYQLIPSLLEQEKVQSYLALKYGITKLSVDNVDVSQDERDYFASDATVIWDYSANSTYPNELTGIMQDDGSNLDQTESQNLSADAFVAISNPSAMTSIEALMWGNDDGAMDATGVTDYPAGEGVIARIARVWKVQETGDVGTITLQIDLSTVPESKTAADLRILIDRNLNGLFADETVAGTGIIGGATSLGGDVFEFTGVDFNDGELFSIASVDAGTPLPINLISFTATYSEDDHAVSVEWTTSLEINNKLFIVERSTDAIEFVELGQLDGAGESATSKQYQFTDKNPLRGLSYYRLKQVDFDDSYTFSNIVSVQNSTDFENLKIYPNPTSESFVIDTNGFEDLNLVVTQLDGTIITTQTEKTQQQIKVDTSNLSAGVYLVKISQGQRSRVLKLIIQK